jgi:hypothetical protein
LKGKSTPVPFVPGFRCRLETENPLSFVRRYHMKYLALLPFILLYTFLTFLVINSTEPTRKKIFVVLALWIIPFWGVVGVFSLIPNLPASARLTISIAINAMLGFLSAVFAGAAAGNSNQGSQFSFSILIGLFVLLCLASIILLFKQKTTWAIYLPFATLPIQFIAINLMLNMPWA